jgi:hypothetical protein
MPSAISTTPTATGTPSTVFKSAKSRRLSPRQKRSASTWRTSGLLPTLCFSRPRDSIQLAASIQRWLIKTKVILPHQASTRALRPARQASRRKQGRTGRRRRAVLTHLIGFTLRKNGSECQLTQSASRSRGC